MPRLMPAIMVLTLGLALGHTGVRADRTTSLEVSGLPPGVSLAVAMNGTKLADPVADTSGALAMVLGFADMGKPQVQVQVYLRICKDGRYELHLVSNDADGMLPKDDGSCDDKLLGAFWTNRAARIVVNARAGTLQVSTAGLSQGAKIGLIGGGGAAAAVVAVAAGGGSSTGGSTPPPVTTPPPSTTPPPTTTPPPSSGIAVPERANITTTMTNNAHPQLLPPNMQLQLALSGSTLTVTSPGTANFPTFTGTYSSSNGQATLKGTTTVAGFSNVECEMQITITSSGQVSGTIRLGTNGALPGGQSGNYSFTGQRV